MSPTTFFVSLFIAWSILYIALPGWLMFRGWFLSGGLVQLNGAVLPGIWQGILWPNEAGNFGLLMVMLIPIPLWIIASGLVAHLVGIARWAYRASMRR